MYELNRIFSSYRPPDLGDRDPTFRDTNDSYSSWHESQPHPQDQYEIFAEALSEMKGKSLPHKRMTGRLIDPFRECIGALHELLIDVDPNATPDYLFPGDYKTLGTYEKIEALPESSRQRIRVLRLLRYDELLRIGDEVVRPIVAGQTIPEGHLNVPAFRRQGDGANHAYAMQGCFNACFRMVFGDLIPQWRINEASLATAVENTYGERVIHDEEYLKLFFSGAFKKLCQKQLHVTTFTGIDLDAIQKTTAKIKDHIPGSKCYAIVNIGSESHTAGVLHTNVLLSADEKNVYCHDPTYSLNGEKGANRPIAKADFARRWAIGLNRAHLITAIGHD